MKTFVRFAIPTDSTQIIQLSKQLGYTIDESDINRICNKSKNRHILLVAYTEDNIIGWAEFALLGTLVMPNTAMLYGLITDEKYRNQGVGHSLLKAGETWAKENGASSIRFHSSDWRTEAHSFYEKMGYKKLKSQIQFIKEI